MSMKFYGPENGARIATTDGHIVIVPPDGCELHERFHAQAYAAGCVSEAQLSRFKKITEAEDQQEKQPAAPNEERQTQIKTVLIQMLNGNDPDDFNESGQPNLRRVNARLGFQSSRDEVDATFAALQAEATA